MRDYVDIGPTPPNEDCEQVGEHYNSRKARQECQAYIHQLRRFFGEEPEGARLSIKTHPHDFGSYTDVVCYYDTDIEASVEYAFKCESDGPSDWDDQALIELSKSDPKYLERL